MAGKSLEERQAEMRERVASEKGNAAASAPIQPTTISLGVTGQTGPPKAEAGPNEISREDLYSLVWSEPIGRLAGRFGVSDVAVAKACRKHNIPLPGRGYWAQIAAGQKLRKTPLPTTQGQDPTIVFSPPELKPEPPVVKSSLQIPIPATTRSLHPIAAQTYAELRQQLQSKDRRHFGNDWGRSWARSGLLNIRVTAAQLDRAIRIASAVLTAAAKLGYTIRIGDPPRYERDKRVEVVVEGIPLTIEMFEPVRQTKHVPTPAEQREIDRGHEYMVPKYDFHSKGKLQLTLHAPRTSMSWHHTLTQTLEEQLGNVIETMLTLSKSEQERQKQEVIEAQRRMEAEKRRHEEEQRIKRLEKQLTFWKRAEEIRAYAKTVEAAMKQPTESEAQRSEVVQWIAWMRKYADRLDPSTRDDLARYPEYVW